VLTVCFEIAHLAYLPSLVAREQLADGNAKLEVSRSLAMTVGPGAGGLLVQVLTAPLAILVDALSFLGSAVLLAQIRSGEPPPDASSATDRPGLRSSLAEGLKLVAGEPSLRTMAASLCVFNLFTQWVGGIYVLYVIRELGLPPAVLGLVYTAGGVAFTVGALLAPMVARRIGIGPAIVWGAGVSDASFLLLPLTAAWPDASAVILTLALVVGTLTGPITAISQLTLRQALTPDRLQGRVNATMRTIAQGAGPLGALAGGLLGEVVGLWPSMLIGVVGIQLGFVILLLSPLRRMDTVPAG
jgi:predicted MFS family arabinose efflux permease